MNKIRPAVKAGSWYPSDPEELYRILQLFAETSQKQLNASELAACRGIAAIAPHAGFSFSGNCAARAYYALAQKSPNPQTVIVFGATHSYCPTAAGVWADGLWQTPLGSIEVDTELAQQILRLEYADEDYTSQLCDNAIELQTPLLKFFFPESRILPIAVPPSSESAALGKDLAAITAGSDRNYLVIASSDLTHYGAAYGFAPAGSGIEGIEWARNNDRRLLRMIETLEVEGIIPEAASRHNACGSGAITAALSFARSRGAESALTLEHILSYDIMPSDPPELSVGYASIVI